MTVVFGDFKVHLEEYLNNKQSQQKDIFCSLLVSYGFKYTVHNPTHIPTNGKPSCIDNFITNLHTGFGVK